MDAKKVLLVTNRSASEVIYRIPENNVRREFKPGESKKIEYQELEKLTFRPGGRELLTNYLQVSDPAVNAELNVHTEPEYSLTPDQIVNLIQTGSLDAFLDCLDFAPKGVIDMIKDFSVKLPMMDLPKREALKEKTGFDVTKVLAHLAEETEEENSGFVADIKQRRVPVEQEDSTPVRRTTPKYNVVKKSN